MRTPPWDHSGSASRPTPRTARDPRARRRSRAGLILSLLAFSATSTGGLLLRTTGPAFAPVPTGASTLVEQLDFGSHALGADVSAQVFVVNRSPLPVVLLDAVVFDRDADDFTARLVEDAPFTLASGAVTSVAVSFQPQGTGPRSAQLQIVHADRPAGASDPVVALTGTGREGSAGLLANLEQPLPSAADPVQDAAASQPTSGGDSGATGATSAAGGSAAAPGGGTQAASSLTTGSGTGSLGGPPRTTSTRQSLDLRPAPTPTGGGGGPTTPVIDTITASAGSSGGDEVTITGAGFDPGSLTVHWGNTTIAPTALTQVEDDLVVFDAPAHVPGLIWVSIETTGGTTNSKPFAYTSDGGVPIAFTFTAIAESIADEPTCAAWGPDGRFYVGTLRGTLFAIPFGDTYTSGGEVKYTGVSNLSNDAILGIAFNPFDSPSPVKVYVAHTELYAQGGLSFTGPSPYPGSVSVLTGPSFNNPQPLITGLPTSNHDHGMNGMLFDHNGDLLLCSGGNTNAGVEDKDMGDLPESPLSCAVIRARLSLGAAFDGDIEYVFRGTSTGSDDQVDGHDVVLKPGADLDVWASGFRNSFDLVLHTNGYLYNTDNGPNSGFGKESTGASSQSSSDAAAPDELNLVEYDHYYGHPNRARGPDDARQYVYRAPDDASIPGNYDEPMRIVASSTNGIDEYRATTFESAMRGDLLVQEWSAKLARVELSPDGEEVEDFDDTIATTTSSLTIETGPGGAILGLMHQGEDINTLVPNDASAKGVVAYDVFPWRAPASGGTTLVIGGKNFTTLADTTVTIGGQPATVTSVTSRRIKAIVPAEDDPTTDLLDVVVRCGDEQSTIPEAFRYLFVPMGNEPGAWAAMASSPQGVGEVAAGNVHGTLIVVGATTPHTLACDLPSGTWEPAGSRAERPYAGHHHTAEVVDGKLYLFGGLSAGSAGKVQIYDPLADTWTLGADMPWAGGACSSALIDGLVYVAGGFENEGSTTDALAAYDPGRDQWSSLLAPMPAGRTLAQAATDGTRFWIFGGRGPGSGDTLGVAHGLADVQVYDPATDTWESSDDPGSRLQPLPIGRGGGGRAVHFHGRFWIIGGATDDGPGAHTDGISGRVDVYDPQTHTWRLDAPMPTARHGIFPVVSRDKIVVVGGTTSGGSHSTKAEVFTRR